MIYLVIKTPFEGTIEVSDALEAEKSSVDWRHIHVGPFQYAWSSGLTHLVADEVDLAFSSNGRSQEDRASFLNITALKRVLDKEVRHLSGGWSKYLLFALALWLSDRTHDLIVHGASQFLDDELIGRLLDVARRRSTDTYLVELDPLSLAPFSDQMELLILEAASGRPTDPFITECRSRFGK